MKLRYILYSILLLSLNACDRFLDEKPDIAMLVPKTLADCELLLNDYVTLNMSSPVSGEIGIDDYYLMSKSWQAITKPEQKNAYIWRDAVYDDNQQWQKPYKTVYLSNQIMEIVADIEGGRNTDAYKKVLGAAHFFRAFAFHQITEVFAPAYQQSTASSELGIPLRLSAGIDEPSVRANLEDTYAQILKDYNVAIQHLPKFESIIGRPHKATAYAGMARAYLDMGKFAEAYAYADSSLALRSELLDFNKLKAYDEYPIPANNVEVLLSAIIGNAGPLGMARALVADDVYNSYHTRDLRKTMFFEMNDVPEDSYAYKGSYDNGYNSLFVGFTSSEMYLVRAEAAARTGKIDQALQDLNSLLEKRWRATYYTPSVERDPNLLLDLILKERRKELLFKGRRWADLKRLNLEPRYAKKLIRNIDGKEYSIEPNDPKYAFRIPETVINLSKVVQNKR